MRTYDVIVLGGGIAGLYASLVCRLNGYSVCTVEQDNRWGGRIHTVHRDGEVYEAGAARFHKGHRRLIRLVKRYGIEMVELDGRQREYRAVLCGAKPVTSPSYELIKQIVSASKQHPAALLRSMTLGEFTEMVLGSKNRELVRLSFGYDGEFEAINAYDGVQMFSRDFKIGERFYVCRNGLSDVIHRMVTELEGLGEWDSMLEHRVENVRRDGSTSTYSVTVSRPNGSRTHLRTKAVIAALPRKGLAGIRQWDQQQLAYINSVTDIPLERIYAKYSTPWIAGARITTTDLPIRQFIPINDKFAMVSYSDIGHADRWNSTAAMGQDRLATRVRSGLKELFPERKVPVKPEWIEAYYWDNGVHMWGRNVNSIKASKYIRELLWDGSPDSGFYVCGEAYSTKQCWVDGALQTVDDVIPLVKKLLDNKNGSKKTEIKKDGGATWIAWAKERAGENSLLKKADLEELKRAYPDAKWVLFQDRLLNIEQWYYIHPGGQWPFDQHMHKDIYPFFNKIGHHHVDGDTRGNIKDGVMKKVEGLTIARILV